MHFISITRLRLRSIFFLPGFVFYAIRSSRQAQTASGNLSFDTRREPGLIFWTKTVWTEEAAMKYFRNAGAHQKAMRYMSEWCDEGSYTQWVQDAPDMPSWEMAHERLLKEGKLSKLKHPSPLHLAQRTAPPLS